MTARFIHLPFEWSTHRVDIGFEIGANFELAHRNRLPFHPKRAADLNLARVAVNARRRFSSEFKLEPSFTLLLIIIPSLKFISVCKKQKKQERKRGASRALLFASSSSIGFRNKFTGGKWPTIWPSIIGASASSSSSSSSSLSSSSSVSPREEGKKNTKHNKRKRNFFLFVAAVVLKRGAKERNQSEIGAQFKQLNPEFEMAVAISSQAGYSRGARFSRRGGYSRNDYCSA